MTGRSIRAGIVGAAALAAFYITVIGLAAGASHLATQARTDWPYLVAIVVGFGTQLALLVELRHRRRVRHLEQATGAAGAGASVVGMIACCAHHLAELVPFIGVSGAAAFLTNRRTELMLVGIAVNALGVTFAVRRLRDDSRHTIPTGSAWHAT